MERLGVEKGGLFMMFMMFMVSWELENERLDEIELC